MVHKYIAEPVFYVISLVMKNTNKDREELQITVSDVPIFGVPSTL